MRDNSPKKRQIAQLKRKKAARKSYDRFLIISEGSKTEPLYFKGIKNHYRIMTANIQIFPSDFGTDPLSVVNFAEETFIHGNSSLRIPKRAFEQVYAIFDRDDHTTYHQALDKAESLNRKLKNDLNSLISFKALTSVPSFELWLLLHFEKITHPIDRFEALRRLKVHISDYKKGQAGIYQQTRDNLNIAMSQAKEFSKIRSAHDDDGPSCSVHELIELLENLTNS